MIPHLLDYAAPAGPFIPPAFHSTPCPIHPHIRYAAHAAHRTCPAGLHNCSARRRPAASNGCSPSAAAALCPPPLPPTPSTPGLGPPTPGQTGRCAIAWAGCLRLRWPAGRSPESPELEGHFEGSAMDCATMPFNQRCKISRCVLVRGLPRPNKSNTDSQGKIMQKTTAFQRRTPKCKPFGPPSPELRGRRVRGSNSESVGGEVPRH